MLMYLLFFGGFFLKNSLFFVYDQTQGSGAVRFLTLGLTLLSHLLHKDSSISQSTVIENRPQEIGILTHNSNLQLNLSSSNLSMASQSDSQLRDLCTSVKGLDL